MEVVKIIKRKHGYEMELGGNSITLMNNQAAMFHLKKLKYTVDQSASILNMVNNDNSVTVKLPKAG